MPRDIPRERADLVRLGHQADAPSFDVEDLAVDVVRLGQTEVDDEGSDSLGARQIEEGARALAREGVRAGERKVS